MFFLIFLAFLCILLVNPSAVFPSGGGGGSLKATFVFGSTFTIISSEIIFVYGASIIVVSRVLALWISFIPSNVNTLDNSVEDGLLLNVLVWYAAARTAAGVFAIITLWIFLLFSRCSAVRPPLPLKTFFVNGL